MYDINIIQLAVNDHESRQDRFNRVELYLEDISKLKNPPLMVMLPELWGTGFFNFDRYHNESEPLLGETFSRLAPWAEKIGCYLLGGSVVEHDGLNYYNSTIFINPNGTHAGTYRKIHLFGYQSAESKVLSAGSEIYVLKTCYGTWGFSTCYDLRFPELYRAMVNQGVEMFFIIAAWPLARLEHWLLLNRTRALENLSYVVACNCAGSLKGNVLAGNSLVVNPWGEIIKQGGSGEELLQVTIDPGLVAATRAEFPALQDRCPGLNPR